MSGEDRILLDAIMREHLPSDLSERLGEAYRTRSRPKHCLSCYAVFIEGFVKHLAHFFNSLYCTGAYQHDKVESELRVVASAPNVSVGLSVRGLRALRIMCQEFEAVSHRDVLLAKLPESASYFVQTWSIAREARKSWRIQPSLIPDYIEKNRSQSGAKTLSEFLNAVVEIRNGVAHANECLWWPKPNEGEKEWASLLIDALEPAIAQLLLWAPMKSFLESVEVATLLGATTQQGSQYVAEVRRSRPCSTQWRVRVPKPLEEKQELFVSEPGGDGFFRVLAPRRPFPSLLKSETERADEYKRQTLKFYLHDGILSDDERVKLKNLAKREGIRESDAKEHEQEIRSCLEQCIAHRAAGQDGAHLADALEGRLQEHWHDDSTPLSEAIGRVDELQQRWLLSELEKEPSMRLTPLAEKSGLTKDAVSTHLKQLVGKKLVTQVFSELEDMYKLRRPKEEDRFSQMIEEIVVAKKKISESHFTVLLLAAKYLDVRLLTQKAESLTVEGLVKGIEDLEDLQEREAESKESLGARGKKPGRAPMVLTVDGQDFEAKRIKKLIEALAASFGDQDRFKKSCPRPVGRTRYFVNTEGVHRNGTKFAAPIKAGGLVFEGNWRREEALFNLVEYLTDCGFEARSPDLEMEEDEVGVNGSESLQGDELETEVGQESIEGESSDTTSRLLTIRLKKVCGELLEEPLDISGKNVRDFLNNVVQTISDHKAFDSTELPVTLGRVRCLIAEQPFHGNGKAFGSRQEVVIQDRDQAVGDVSVWLDVALTRENAVKGAVFLCTKMEIEATAVDFDSDQDELMRGKPEITGVEMEKLIVKALEELGPDGDIVKIQTLNDWLFEELQIDEETWGKAANGTTMFTARRSSAISTLKKAGFVGSPLRGQYRLILNEAASEPL